MMKNLYRKGFGNPLAALVATVVLVVTLLLLGHSISRTLYTNAIYLDEGWEIEHNGNRQPAALSQYVFPRIQRGDQVTLRGILPETPFGSTHMQLRIWHCTIDISVGGQPIFTYGGEDYEAGRPVGGGYQWVELPREFAGKTVEIRLLAVENECFTQLAPPMLYSSAEMVVDFIRVNSTMAVIGIFLLSLGLVLLLVASVVLLGRRDAIQLLWIAILALDVGLWVLCRYGVFQLVSTNVQISYYFEYLGLYLTPPLGLLCVYAIQGKQRKPPLLTAIFLALNLLYAPVLVLLDLIGIIYLAETLRVCHAFIFASCIFIFVYCFRRRHNTAERIKLMGVTVLTVFAVLDLVFFMWDAVLPQSSVSVRYSMAAIGSVLFILFLLLNYGLTSVQHFYADAETALLKKMAYTDSLTALSNRAQANAVMEEMDTTPEIPGGMLLFDLNNLKETNDLLGHAVGDELICALAHILRESFSSLGTVSRIGGDEFVVLLRAPVAESVTAALADMHRRIDDHNATQPSAPVSVAYGAAYSGELAEWNTEALYRLADERMYSRKAEMKNFSPQKIDD